MSDAYEAPGPEWSREEQDMRDEQFRVESDAMFERELERRVLARAVVRELRINRRLGRMLTDAESMALVQLGRSLDFVSLRAALLRQPGVRLVRRRCGLVAARVWP